MTDNHPQHSDDAWYDLPTRTDNNADGKNDRARAPVEDGAGRDGTAGTAPQGSIDMMSGVKSKVVLLVPKHPEWQTKTRVQRVERGNSACSTPVLNAADWQQLV